jgi:hypothetical protein
VAGNVCGRFSGAPAGTPTVHLSVVARGKQHSTCLGWLDSAPPDWALHVAPGLPGAPLHPLLLRRRLPLGRESYTSTLAAVAVRLKAAITELITQQRQNSGAVISPWHGSTLADSLHDVQFCMNQLPEEACPIVLLVTDGTVAAPDMSK